jgi:hypothetical protein
MPTCNECQRLQEAILNASANLVAAQRELASRQADADASFLRLCENGTNALSALQDARRVMIAHLDSHRNDDAKSQDA